MAKCKHENGQFNEWMRAVHTRDVEKGEMPRIGYNEMGEITGYDFTCYDCKKTFRWSWSGAAPKWAQKYFDGLNP